MDKGDSEMKSDKLKIYLLIFLLINTVLLFINIYYIFLINIRYGGLTDIALINYTENDLIKEIGRPDKIIKNEGGNLIETEYKESVNRSQSDLFDMPVKNKVFVYYDRLSAGGYYVFFNEKNEVEKIFSYGSDRNVIWLQNVR